MLADREAELVTEEEDAPSEATCAALAVVEVASARTCSERRRAWWRARRRACMSKKTINNVRCWIESREEQGTFFRDAYGGKREESSSIGDTGTDRKIRCCHCSVT